MKNIDINDYIKTEYSEDYIPPKCNVRMRAVVDEGKIKEVMPSIEIPLEEHIANKMAEQYFMGYKTAVDTILIKMVELANAMKG